ncbi:hypothetical protein [Leptolyngbya sp. FACHB-16]|uniref:hypothetical protein n=1 Tax=unclassified Leptolyngbya TaxID=2650499 RepID=UPI0016836C2D|nr:hypothetical protein [Leptolyngbya sp. FACHB-16]MBD2156722.1 hypothetical protein [Leptolyngbya sp. FACHB-16]
MSLQQQQPIVSNQTVPPISPIDPKSIVEHGENTASIILAIAILITALVSSITQLVRVLAVVMVQQSKSTQ